MAEYRSRSDLAKPDYGLLNPETAPGTPATLQFQYQFKFPFLNVAEGFLKKYNWESRFSLTTVNNVQQLDDDRIVFYRRHETADMAEPAWEEVVINRQNKSIESSVVARNPNGSTYTIARDVIRPDQVAGSQTSTIDSYVYDIQGKHAISSVETFKGHVTKLLKAIQFTKWETEE